jgi:DNA-binding transcriptional MocR family regulator
MRWPGRRLPPMSSRACGACATRRPTSSWLPLAEEVRADQVAQALMRDGISVSTAEPFATSAQVPHAIRLALGSVGLDTLRDALAQVRRTIDAHAV